MTPLRQRMIEDMQLRNLCAETQRNYVHHVAGLARFYQTSPEYLSLEEIREYQLYLINERRLSPDAVNQFVSAAKFLYNITLETPWPEDVLPRCRVPHKLPVVLSATETHEFFQHVCTIRYRAALMTAYGAGLRVSEVVALRVGDIDSQRMLIRVQQGKGKKDRYAMLSPRLLELLRCWWRSRHPARQRAHTSPDDWLFPGWRKGRHMNTESLQTTCREAARAAGLHKRVTVHTLRHSFATHMLENGTDIRLIQALLGHTRIDTTARYAAVSPNAIAAVRSPLDRLGQPSRPSPKTKAKR
ncbi:MAG TPA: site-specific integrase [Candidatus Angelobacter sp.]|nr:site-specific integrase [Candidatus Angelobacter sp.]